jgi:hypothetical protein
MLKVEPSLHVFCLVVNFFLLFFGPNVLVLIQACVAEARLQQLYEKDPFRALAGLVDTYRAAGDVDKALSRLKLE